MGSILFQVTGRLSEQTVTTRRKPHSPKCGIIKFLEVRLDQREEGEWLDR